MINKTPRNVFFSAALFFAFFLIFPQQITAQVSPDAERAFREANIRVLNKRADPPDFTLPLLTGENRTLSAYKGKVVILNFWATWCPPCRAEMPSMETLYQRFKNQGLEILAVDSGEKTAIVRQFIQDNQYTFPILMDESDKVGTLYGIEAIPTSYIIDRGGKIIATIIGRIQWDNPKVIAAFNALLISQ